MRAKKYQNLINMTSEVIRLIRNAYYISSEPRDTPYNQPPDMSIFEQLGPFPEFIFHSVSCQESLKGNCTPCFYSRYPPIHIPRRTIYESLVLQMQFILDNFEELVLKRQTRGCPFPRINRRFEDGRDIMIAIGVSGSFFSENELPHERRLEILRLLDEFSVRKKLNLQVHLESRAEDVIKAYRAGVFNDLEPFIRNLNLTDFIGLESRDEFVRNVLYNKNLKLQDYEKALEIHREFGIETATFVFAGFHSMTENEIVADVEKTVKYLVERGTSPVIMTPNLQEYSFNHLLYTFKRYKLIEPRTVLKLARILLNETTSLGDRRIDPWFMLIEGNAPPPVLGVFNNPDMITCKECSNMIYHVITQLKRDYNDYKFLKNVPSIDNCTCNRSYKEKIVRKEERISLEERAIRNIQFARSMKEEYIRLLKL